MNLPRYFIGCCRHHEQMVAAKKGEPGYRISQQIGRYDCWTPDAARNADSHEWYVMHDAKGIPHPEWVELPHILSPVPVKQHLASHTEPQVIAALAHSSLPVTDTDTCYSLVEKLHAKMEVFLP